MWAAATPTAAYTSASSTSAHAAGGTLAVWQGLCAARPGLHADLTGWRPHRTRLNRSWPKLGSVEVGTGEYVEVRGVGVRCSCSQGLRTGPSGGRARYTLYCSTVSSQKNCKTNSTCSQVGLRRESYSSGMRAPQGERRALQAGRPADKSGAVQRPSKPSLLARALLTGGPLKPRA